MEDDGTEVRILVVAVGVPAGGLQIDFDVAAHGCLIGELNDRAAKIGSAFDAEETGVKYPDGAPVQRAQMITPEALLLPDGLEEAFGWRLGDFVERRGEAALPPPAGVEAVVARGHANCFCAGRVAKSSCGCWSSRFLSAWGLNFGNIIERNWREF